eukprot:CAMPEP_0201122280 /NCGR_PEP_ID=MMETSP0850-20130426/5958_1 /ASSEMBLY_ACC=CAM_ASM_000622 /TAXON_ID=183588 /ORGANISM="Pseudo-nitzschia fraudulenta, Strain WWA7" /LENGTH=988 /DNA_ID=CAMNT_0047388939 /DNA_START=49 /DNA_END=3015 /DNA_ORIENTATION=+
MVNAYDASSVASVTTMASAMLFGTIIFATTALAVRAYLSGSHKQLFDAASHPRSSALNVKSLSSVYTLLFHSSVFGLILFYAYVCEYHPPYQHADKNYDADLFFFLTFFLFVVSAFTWQKHIPDEINSPPNALAPSNAQTEVLNRNQTEEWKGWMQFMFLLYHYYHAEEVYNAIRIMITCYVWMTGFGNFSFFYMKADYGIIRVLQMLWRLNFLVLFLCLTQGTTFILYYICLLHTYYFFMVYVVMRIGKEHNYTKWWIRIKLMVLGIVIYLVWDCDLGLFKIMHYPFFGETPMMGATGGAMWEWYFRSSLDHWSTYFGMIFALNFPITSLFFRKLETMPFKQHFLAKALMGVVVFAAFYFWVTGPFMQGKFDYNQTNAYYGVVPLTAYIFFRNLTPFLRNHSLDLLHQIGKTTLETYLMQHHIWLTSDAKSLLTLVPGWPKVNFLLVSVLYVLMSRRLYQLTLFLRGMVLPDNKAACFKNLGGMISVIVSFVVMAHMMKSQGLLSLGMVGFVSLVFGYFLYSFLLNYTGVASIETSIQEQPGTSFNRTMIISCVVAALAVASCGLSWHTMAMTGGSKIRTLPASCDVYANKGQWMSLNGCDEGPRGEEYRKFGVSPVSTCSAQNPVYVWGWDEQKPSSHCRFKQRDLKSLKKHLKDRTIYFAGDSITRYMYHAFCRQLGIADSGKYDAKEGKHHNLSQQIGDIKVDFIWASYATDVVGAIGNLTYTNAEDKLDLVVLGGGAWDKLWRFKTDEEKENLKMAAGDIKKGIDKLTSMKVPVVWFTPTTINTPALPSEEKQERINEDEMKLVRDLYKSQGILSASSFVVDGESFTKTRTSESFDGVHYPHNVYSAGAQILCNAMDWLLPTPNVGLPKPPKQPGEMSHPMLGFFVLCFAVAGIFFFDAFMGFSYLAALVVPSVSPKLLYNEAFSMWHLSKKLPAVEMQNVPSSPSQTDISLHDRSMVDEGIPTKDGDEEMASLVGKERYKSV